MPAGASRTSATRPTAGIWSPADPGRTAGRRDAGGSDVDHDGLGRGLPGALRGDRGGNHGQNGREGVGETAACPNDNAHSECLPAIIRDLPGTHAASLMGYRILQNRFRIDIAMIYDECCG